MKFYLAPMEGLTGHVFRNAYHKYYAPMDKYFTPFVSHPGLSHRELQDVMPEHNEGMNTVPQILTNKADEFLSIAGRLAELGYKEVNLNLGCPSGTVVKKKRGAGMLSDLPMLETFLSEIYEKCSIDISIKTRLGMNDPEEWSLIQEIYEKFPIKELIIHPRVQKDFYKKPVRPAWFAEALDSSSGNIPFCYNGDIFTIDDFKRFRAAFPDIDAVMLGRGILKNPELAGVLMEICRQDEECSSAGRGDASETGEFCYSDIRTVPDFITVEGEFLPISEIERFRNFHSELLEGYINVMDGDTRNAMFKMKEFWFYAGQSFPEAKKALKAIKKAQSLNEYKSAVIAVFNNM